MCINIWQKFHLLHLFSIGLMHEASVLKTFEWKIQKRTEREKGCRKGWAVGRTAGKPEDLSLARAGGFGREAWGWPTKRQDGLQGQHGLFTPTLWGRLPLSCPPSFPFLVSHFPLLPPQRADGSEGRGWSELGTGEESAPGSFLPPQVPAGET